MTPTVSGPVCIDVQAPPLVSAGVRALLGAHTDRVLLLPPLAPQAPDVALVHADSNSLESPPFRRADVPIVLIVPRPEEFLGSRELPPGANRVLPLSVGVRELVCALEAVRDESPRPGPRPGEARPVQLSVREAEVLTGICRGLSNAEIASELFLSVNSIKTYIRSAYRKTSVRTRSQAVVWGVANGYE